MAETPRTRAMVGHMLEALETPTQELSQWEQGFLASQNEKFQRASWMPSEREFEILEGLYADYTV